jgi:nucleotide-binding universal stress UspA family protein
MKQSRESPAGGRVLLTFQTAEAAPDLLSTAVALARSLPAQLSGLFIEDIDLLRLAALPFTREVGGASGTVRAIDLPEVERTLKRQAEHARQSLANVAQKLQLPWSFEVTRGTLLDEVLAAAAADFVVTGRARSVARSIGPGSMAASGEQLVLALFDASDAGFRALTAALHLAHGRPELLSLLVPSNGVKGRNEIEQLAANWLGVPMGSTRMQLVSSPVAPVLARHTRGERRSRALVLPGSSLPDARRQLRVLLDTSECPLVVVR